MSNVSDGTRIHVNELRIGMRVVQLEILEGSSPFLLDIIDVRTQADIQAIQKICEYVFIDVKWQKSQHGYIPTRDSDSSKKLAFARAFEQTSNTFHKTSNLIKTVFDDIRFGNQLSVSAVKEAVSECVEQALENPDAMLLLTQLKNQDEYTAQHSMNVCVCSILLGKELGFNLDELNKVGTCGLLHDIGKMKVPLEILNKPGKLEDYELEIMRKHTVYGRDVLMSARQLFSGTVDVAFSHHEHLDGKGYPRGIDSAGISIFTRVVTVVDAYDAITSDRVYQRGKPHLIALGILVKGMGSNYEGQYVTQFINSIGFYPQGNIVELSSGDVGLVVEQNKADRLKPKILLILDSHKQPIERKILDMSLSLRDADGQLYRIKEIIRPQDHSLDLHQLYQEGAFTKSYPLVS